MVRPHPPDGVIEGDRHYYAVRVYYEDTDLSGIVYHANYLRWFERARSDLLRQLGIDQRAMIEAAAQAAGEGGAYTVAELALRYLRPARLDDDVLIETRCLDLGAASCRMEQSALRGDEELARAQLRVGFIGLDGRPRRQPAEWRRAFAAFIGASPSKSAERSDP